MSRAGQKSARFPVQAPGVGGDPLSVAGALGLQSSWLVWRSGREREKGIKETPGIPQIMQAINLLEVA